eukprot:6212313-Pleurochrysis_carterae.AAC.20
MIVKRREREGHTLQNRSRALRGALRATERVVCILRACFCILRRTLPCRQASLAQHSGEGRVDAAARAPFRPKSAAGSASTTATRARAKCGTRAGDHVAVYLPAADLVPGHTDVRGHRCHRLFLRGGRL